MQIFQFLVKRNFYTTELNELLLLLVDSLWMLNKLRKQSCTVRLNCSMHVIVNIMSAFEKHSFKGIQFKSNQFYLEGMVHRKKIKLTHTY